MKKSTFLLVTVGLFVLFSSCKPTMYTTHTSNEINSSVILTKNNFKNLGTFSGLATARMNTIGVKNREGVISEARKNLLQNAKEAGVELTGSRTLVNMSIDAVSNSNRVTVTIVSDIIEFTGE